MTMVRHLGFGRRRFFEGLGLGAGATLLAPMARGLIGQALGQAPRRKRLVVFTFANGLEQNRYKRAVRGPADYDLSPIFTALAPYKKDLLIVEQLTNPAGANLHGNYNETLTAHLGGPSIDRAVGRAIGASDPFPSTHITLNSFRKPVHWSTDGGGKTFPGEWNPLRQHAKLFGQSAAPGVPADPNALFVRDKSVLDVIAGDITRLQGRLAGEERRKLDQYLESVRGFEQQLKQLANERAMAGRACSNATPPGVKNDADFNTGGQVVPEVVRALIDVSVNGLMCGLTHVIHLGITGGSEPAHEYKFLGSTKDHHGACHDRVIPLLEKIDTFHFGEVAHVWKRLRELPEGDGTMADNTVVMVVNGGGGRHHSGSGIHPIVLLASAERGPFKTGRFLTLPTRRYLGDLFFTVANAVGADLKAFGDPAHATGHVTELTTA
jgi:hypothetical protein